MEAKMYSLQRQSPWLSYSLLYLASLWPTWTFLFNRSFILLSQSRQLQPNKTSLQHSNQVFLLNSFTAYFYASNNPIKILEPIFVHFRPIAFRLDFSLILFSLEHITDSDVEHYYQMIARISRLLPYNKNFFLVSTPKKIIKPPTPKAPLQKPKANELSLSSVALQLKINEDSLRMQLLNPKTNFVNKEELRILSIINGVEMPQSDEGGVVYKKKSPVITIMGHVDHGKTTLIDFLRSSSIAQGEVGGITQKIGAFHITCHGEKITFIDTPGHQAFSNMRRRGALVTDMIVLIVAATEGVKKQTQEIIDMIVKDKIPCIVAINKIDLPHADVENTENSIYEAGLNIEPKGGDIPVIHISAKTGQNVELLSELILEETRELKAMEDGMVEGIVLEAYQNSKGFNAMTMIVKQGTLKVGSLLVIGEDYAKVKSFHDDQGITLKQAKPGDAIQVIGIPNIPVAGDFIYEVSDQNKAKFITSKRKQMSMQDFNKEQQRNTVKTAKLRLDYRSRKAMYGSASNDAWLLKFQEKQNEINEKIQQFRELSSKEHKYQQLLLAKEQELANHKQYVYQFLVNIGVNKSNFNVILRFADRGIEETIHEQIQPIIQRLKTKNDITVNILKTDIGEVTVNDLEEAQTCSAEIFTFGTQVSSDAILLQKETKIVTKVHRLIHNFLKDFEESAIARKKGAMIKGTEKGRCLVADIFKIKGKKGTEEVVFVPGVRVTSGKISKTHKLHVFRNGSPITAELFAKSIKSFKKQMNEVKKGQECTITLDTPPGFEFEKGDQIAAFQQ